MKTLLRASALPLLLALCCAPALVGCGGGPDETSTTDELRSHRKCHNDAGCYNGFVCKSGRCESPGTPPPPPAKCTANKDCGHGQVCVSGACQACTSDKQCDAGQVCNAGACQTPTPPPATCTVNTDCTNYLACISGTCQACTADAQCNPGLFCTAGQCKKPKQPPPPPPPPAGGCVTEHDCGNGGLCQSGTCVASACQNRSSTKTGIRATVVINRYQGLIHGSNGDHEIAFGTLGNVEWIHDPALKDSNNVQLAMNVVSSIDPTGLPKELPLAVGQTIEVEGEYITAASANASGAAVIHFTHSTCGYVTIAGSTYK